MSLFSDESERRKFSLVFDEEPSLGQILNYKFIQPHIRGKKVLDVGCWSGQIEKLGIKDAKEIVGIDPGVKAIEFAKRKIPKGRFLVGTIDKIPFENDYFDTVLLLEVLEHIPKNTEIVGLKEINRVLKKNALLLLTTPNNNLFSIFFDPAFFLIGHRHYSEERLREFLEKAGFEVINFSIRGGLIQAIFNNLSLLVKHVLGIKIKETGWVKRNIRKGYMPGGFLTNCVIAKKTRRAF